MLKEKRSGAPADVANAAEDICSIIENKNNENCARVESWTHFSHENNFEKQCSGNA